MKTVAFFYFPNFYDFLSSLSITPFTQFLKQKRERLNDEETGIEKWAEM